MEEQEIRDKMLIELGQSVTGLLRDNFVKNRAVLKEIKETMAEAVSLGQSSWQEIEGIPKLLAEAKKDGEKLLDSMSNIVAYIALLKGSSAKFEDLKKDVQRQLMELVESREQEVAAFKQRIARETMRRA